MLENVGRFIIRQRIPILILIVLLTGFLAANIVNLKVESPTIDLFPQDHPYVETFVKYKDIFGGAGSVMIVLEVEKGDIYNAETLEKIRRITKALELLPGINNYQVLSLAQRKVKTLRVDAERGFRGVPVMWPEIPQTPEEIAKLHKTVLTSPRLNGTLVSRDGKAAMILAGFFEDKFEPLATYRAVDKIISAENDANTKTHVIGRPIMVGFILSRKAQTYFIMVLTILAMIAVLAAYFRDLHGIVIPLITALTSTVWGLGFLGLLNYNFDPLVIVIPFIISARALSHSVQEVERYYEEYAVCRDRNEASVKTFAGLFSPAMVGILADAAAVFLVWFTPIPLLQKLALMGSFWVMSIIVSNVILNPILFTLFPAPKVENFGRKGVLDRILARVPWLCIGPGRNYVLGGSLLVLLSGLIFFRHVVIGDIYPGTPMLWPGSVYNQSTERIAGLFRNTEQLTIVVEGKDRGAIKDPQVLGTIEEFQKKMESLPEVSSTASIADFLPGIISILHGSDPKWELVPEDAEASGFYLEMIYGNSEPSDLVRFVTNDRQNANITLFLKDHKGDTLRTVLEVAKKFIAEHPMEQAQFRPAGGYGGLLAAINEVVAEKDFQITILAFAIIVIFCGLADRSLFAGFLYLLPLVISNYLTYALMGARGIGLDVNALPVVALGVGLGVDYGLYIVGRTKEEYAVCRDLEKSIVTAITTAGRAVAFTASTMVMGVVFWTFSFLRFQAEMGLLLVFWMVVSMLGGLILLPALISAIKPKFIIGTALPAIAAAAESSGKAAGGR